MQMFRAKQDSSGPNGSFYRDRIYELDEKSPFVKSGLERGLFESLQPVRSPFSTSLPPETHEEDVETMEVNSDGSMSDDESDAKPVVAPKRKSKS